MKPPRLIAVDPSYTATGVSLFEDNVLKKVYLLKPDKKIENRLWEIAIRFSAILELFKPEVMAIESQYLAIQSSSVIKVIETKGLLEGLFYSYAIRNEIPPRIISIGPVTAKKAVGVVGRMKRKESKAKVKEAVCKLYPAIAEQSQDVMDSVAIGLAGLREYLSTPVK